MMLEFAEASLTLIITIRFSMLARQWQKMEAGFCEDLHHDCESRMSIAQALFAS